MEYVTLIGAEAVQSAGSRIAAAADQIQRAANQICESHDRHQRFLDDWLLRFKDLLEVAGDVDGD